MKFMRRFYTIFLSLLMPFILLRLIWRGTKAHAYLKRWNERFACFKQTVEPGGIWVHAVSVGEALVAVPLIKRLQKAYPGRAITVTTMTPTGSERIKSLLGDSVFHVYIPYDLPILIKRFLTKIKPQCVLIMETELWPNTLHEIGKRQIPLMICNARLSEKSYKGYRRIQSLTSNMLKHVSVLAAQGESDAKRFESLGMENKNIAVSGNIKFDLTLPSDLENKGKQLRESWGARRPVIIAASTHLGEDEQILEAFDLIKQSINDALLILVPRHPERFNTVAALARKLGFQTVLRTEDNASIETDIFIGNTMGEMMLFFAASDVAFVGGSLIPHGGHNLLEPAALGLASLTGPHVFNFQDIYELLGDAVTTVGNANQFAEAAINLLQNEKLRKSQGSKAKNLLENNRGALDKHLELIGKLLQENNVVPASGFRHTVA